jgi:membrane protease subunit HflK
MAWNEPGGNRDSKDPWGRRGGDSGPPDLDEALRNLQRRLAALFGGRGGGGDGEARGGGGLGGIGALIVGALLIGLMYESVYVIQPAERGVVLRFGAQAALLTPGPHWRWPRPVEQVIRVDVDKVHSAPHKALMLTQDENIVDIKLTVQYKIKDANAYIFNVRDADATLMQATESAVREVVGKSKMDFVITEGRDAVAVNTQLVIQQILDRYQAGLQVIKVNLQDANPPEQVKGAFDDAIKAREDEQRLKNEAEAYANEVVPKARGGAARQTLEANAYREQVIARASGEASRFEQLLAEYEKAPQVTRERLYLDNMEAVLSRSRKLLVDLPGNNVLYLPLTAGQSPAAASQSLTPETGLPPPLPDLGATLNGEARARGRLRGREVR